MKKIIKVKLLFLFLIIGIAAQANDKGKTDYDKKYHESFSINPNAELNIDNGFTNVQIITWDKNEIEISVDVTVEAKSQEKADKWFDKIAVNISGDNNNVHFDSNLKKGSNSTNIEWSIVALIHVPKTIRLNADVEFGNLEIDQITGVCNIDVEFGNFEANLLANSENTVEIEYGNMEVDEMGARKIAVQFGAIEIGKLTSSSDIDSGFSQVEIHYVTSACTNLNVEVEFGGAEITLSSSGNYSIEASSSFGGIDFDNDININENKSGMFDTSMKGKLGDGSGNIDIDSSYSDIEIKVN